MRRQGRSRSQVLADLKRILAKDSKYEDGKVLSSMCAAPQPIAKTAHNMFLSSNLGDPGLFPGSGKLEEDVVSQLSDLLNCRRGVGFVVSGGTEANLMAIWAARNMSNTSSPEVVVPESAHFSFNKICNLLKLKLVSAKVDSTYRVIPDEVERNITKNTVAIVGTAGTAELGVVDPIECLSKIAVARNVHLHVDAAFGGLAIPFLASDMREKLPFDFKLLGVKSLTVDPHKMGMCTIPAGGILFRDKKIIHCIKTDTPYLSENAQYTIVGTRSAASVAATWSVFEFLGREGFKKTVKRCMMLTRFVSKEIEAADLHLLVAPTLNVVAFRTSNSLQTAEQLRKKGWSISYVPRLDCLRVVVMPFLKKRHAKAFIQDLKESVQVTNMRKPRKKKSELIPGSRIVEL